MAKRSYRVSQEVTILKSKTLRRAACSSCVTSSSSSVIVNLSCHPTCHILISAVTVVVPSGFHISITFGQGQSDRKTRICAPKTVAKTDEHRK